VVEILSFLPSILLVQFFRHIQSRRAHRQESPLRQAISQMKQQPMEPVKKKRSGWVFPWWCLFIAYGLSAILTVVSIFFIIVRGIEFGDLKCQKWLTSLLSSFFSSILVIQPLKVSSFVMQAETTSIALDCGPGDILRPVLPSERQGEGQGGGRVHR
jgi:hypothetical protein